MTLGEFLICQVYALGKAPVSSLSPKIFSNASSFILVIREVPACGQKGAVWCPCYTGHHNARN